MKINTYKQLIAATVFGAFSLSSHASLIPAEAVNDTGTGIGNVNTVLTLKNDNQKNGGGGNPNPNYGMSSGSVFRDSAGGGTDGTTGDVQSNGNAEVLASTWSFDQLNVMQTSQLRLIFNPVEPGGDSIRLESLVLSIYSDDGQFLWDSGQFAPITFSSSVDGDDTGPGTGKSGYAFKLDIDQALDSQLFWSPSNRIGLSASLSSANGGHDTFFVLVLDDDGEGPGNEVPEPGSVALLGLGIAGMMALRRRKPEA